MAEVVVVHVVAVHELDSPHILRREDAFKAGNEQPERKTLLGPYGLAVHAVGHKHIVHGLGDRMLDAPFTSSTPSATNHVAVPFTPHSLSSVESSTPVHSAQLVIPCDS
jgi:hypothetical protein